MNLIQQKVVDMVRGMPDDELFALVRGEILGGGGKVAKSSGFTHPLAGTPSAPAAKLPAKSKPGKAKSKRKSHGVRGQKRDGFLAAVEAVVKAGKGMSASQITAKVKAPQPRVAAVLRDLKLAGRICQGGERRFARYAADQKTADAKSKADRKN